MITKDVGEFGRTGEIRRNKNILIVLLKKR